MRREEMQLLNVHMNICRALTEQGVLVVFVSTDLEAVLWLSSHPTFQRP